MWAVWLEDLPVGDLHGTGPYAAAAAARLHPERVVLVCVVFQIGASWHVCV
jgi:hypothetical protein